MRAALACLIGLAISCSADPPSSFAAPTKRALLVGIDKYASPGVRTLTGAVRDVETMRHVLETRFEVPPANVTVLTNEHATRAGILSAIESKLIAPSQQGDIVILYYAGHGSQMRDDGADESDGWDETIVPHDARTTDVFDITDDEINGMLRELSRRSGNVTFIFDSCHSGTISRALVAGADARRIEADPRTPPAPSQRAVEGRDLADGPSDLGASAAGYVLLSAARADELAYERGDADSRNGALTYHLTNSLRGAKPQATWRDIMDGVTAEVTAEFGEQHPQVEGGRQDSLLFGDDAPAPDPFVLVSPGAAGLASVGAGAAIGLAAGATLDVYAPGTKQFRDAAKAARIELTTVDAFTSQAKILEGTVENHSRAAIQAVHSQDFKLGVRLESPPSPALDPIRSALTALPYVRLDATPSEAAIRIRETSAGIEIANREGLVVSPAVASGPGSADKVVDSVKKWARWHGLLQLENPTPGLGVGLALHRVGDPESAPPPRDLEAGKDQVEVVLTNTSGTKIYAVILVLSEDGSIITVPRAGDPAIELPGSIPFKRTFKAVLEADRSETTDVVKVIAATEPIPTTLFSQTAARAIVTPLARLLEDPELGARQLEPIDINTWTTRSVKLRIVRSPASSAQVAVHFDTEDEANRARGIAPSRNLGPDADMGGLEGTVIVSRGGARGPAADESTGKAFEEAYAAARELGSKRAEPLLDVEIPAQPAARGGRSADEQHDPRTKDSPLWHIQATNTDAAWKLIRDRRGAVEGEEARGVAVAHVDTGYRPHPEIWSMGPDGRTVWHEAGYDYFAKRDDALDDLLDDRLLDNPAHGTGSGSAISSPTGSQTPGYDKGASGPGRGSRLVPIRVHRSVVHFSTTNLVQAILDASGTDRTRVKTPTSFISLSMGGVPTYSLWKAVRKAEERGYLIIAAAGNHVRTVVWPARFESVLAVGATNIGCKPWAHTSRGGDVDVSAPGESVWRGIVDVETGKDITSRGTGTTYGTATTAGVAALWYALHRGTSAFQRLEQEKSVARVFRNLVTKTSWKPGGTLPPGVQCDTNRWDARENGDGIVDAAALLAASIDDAGSRALAPQAAEGLLDLPLFSTLYPDGTPPAVVSADYRKLFKAGTADPGMFEVEILHHFTLDEDLADSLDRMAARGDRSDAAFERIRDILKARNLSPSLRAALA